MIGRIRSACTRLVADRQDRVEVGSSAYAPVMQPNPLAALLLADFEPTTCTAHRARRAAT